MIVHNSLNKSHLEKAGFTLIELLVVVAIIGVLSTIVFASLNSARDKNANATIKFNLRSIQTQAEIFYSDNGTFNGLCTNPIVASITSSTANIIGGTVNNNWSTGASVTLVNCHVDPISFNRWAVASGLKITEGTSTIWCVDYLGNSKGMPVVSFTSGKMDCS